MDWQELPFLLANISFPKFDYSIFKIELFQVEIIDNVSEDYVLCNINNNINNRTNFSGFTCQSIFIFSVYHLIPNDELDNPFLEICVEVER